MPRAYVPEAGDIVWLNLTPQAGHEQAGRRPVLVLSPRAYNQKTNLMVCCPMMTQIKNYPFEVEIASTTPSGVVLADRIKSLDGVFEMLRVKGRHPQTNWLCSPQLYQDR